MPEKLLSVLASFRITLPEEWRTQHNVPLDGHVKAVWNDENSELRIIPVTVKVEEKKD